MIIRAHSVPMLPNGLSAFQERLIRSDKVIRLVSAPTGSGKTYAFMRAVLEDREKRANVLFIVPTKRLLQNLMKDARTQAHEYFRGQGWRPEWIEKWIEENIVEWSGNQVKSDGESLSEMRARQILNRGVSGRVIFAIPEVVVQMIAGQVRVRGASALGNPFFFVRQFDHVVFDEFHTIDDRAFGLVCLFSRCAVEERQAKVSLLSATPIDVSGILHSMGIDPADIELVTVSVEEGHPPGCRPIHGDVELSLVDCTLAEAFARSMDKVRTEVAGGRAVIVIYDSVQKLIQERPKIKESLAEAGLCNARVLSINSIDDSKREPGEEARGREYGDPHDYDVLLCTSSVENGVTFRSSLMFMEPGHNLASFTQRVGRVSRGADDGNVVISLPEARRNPDGWTRTIADLIGGDADTDVVTFTRTILREVRRRFEPTQRELAKGLDDEGSGDLPYYRRPSWRGAYWAALFILAIQLNGMKVQQRARSRLRKISPRIVKFMRSNIEKILSIETVDDNRRKSSQPHKRWVDALLSSALSYRDIGATVVVVDPNGTRYTCAESFLRRATSILKDNILSDEDGERVVQLKTRTLHGEIEDFAGNWEEMKLSIFVASPLGHSGFSLLISERERGTEPFYKRLF